MRAKAVEKRLLEWKVAVLECELIDARARLTLAELHVPRWSNYWRRGASKNKEENGSTT